MRSIQVELGDGVFPTHVGMNRNSWQKRLRTTRIPHTRGDEPQGATIISLFYEYSPHTWG